MSGHGGRKMSGHKNENKKKSGGSSHKSKNLLSEQSVFGVGGKGTGPMPAMEGNKKTIPRTANLMKDQKVFGMDKKMV